MQKRDLEKNRFAGHSKKEKIAIKRNGIILYFNREDRMKSANGDMSEVNFLNQEIIKYNWQRKKKTRL